MEEHEVPSLHSGSRMLESLGLGRNPYVDRTAEKSLLQTQSFYLHSDLQGFRPSETTYLYFGRRGSGKTTIRLMMMQKYEQHNQAAFENETIKETNPTFETTKEKPVFIVDLCQPGSLQNSLKAFMKRIDADEDNWDARFPEFWTSADVADCILSCAINSLVKEVSHNSSQGQRIVKHLKKDRRSAAQFLLLAHLFTQEDSNTLNYLRSTLLPFQIYMALNPRVIQNYQYINTGGLTFLLLAGKIFFSNGSSGISQREVKVVTPPPAAPEPELPPAPADSPKSDSYLSKLTSKIPSFGLWGKTAPVEPAVAPVHESTIPVSRVEPTSQQIIFSQETSVNKTFAAVCAGISLGLFAIGYAKVRKYRKRTTDRLEKVCKTVRVVTLDQSRVKLLKTLLGTLVSPNDSADTVIRLYLGESAQSKLELLNSLCVGCGYTDGVAVFGDCFDEVGLLDPLRYSSSLKAFAREVCRNEILNRGRLHFFFPDSRAALDLSTDKVVREARFDRHFVRDLTWSRFQLLDLAKKRFLAAQWDYEETLTDKDSLKKAAENFSSLFKHVEKEDFSAAISKLRTPRELMVFMTELLARLEACSEENTLVTAADMEVAITKAQQQTI
eukprot:augustus_masked-scaffold_31-processed-gene-0.43-mRNA-1 protein AED:0.12 eAED:0.15 QI:0/-1/0/1/-1/1/1/0/611